MVKHHQGQGWTDKIKERQQVTGVWLYGGNEDIAYRHIAKHRNVIGKRKKISLRL